MSKITNKGKFWNNSLQHSGDQFDPERKVARDVGGDESFEKTFSLNHILPFKTKSISVFQGSSTGRFQDGICKMEAHKPGCRLFAVTVETPLARSRRVSSRACITCTRLIVFSHFCNFLANEAFHSSYNLRDQRKLGKRMRGQWSINSALFP